MEDNVFEVNKKLVKEIISTIEEDMSNEEVINLLLERKVSVNMDEKYTIGQKTADKLASFAGSWTFVTIFMVCIIGWIFLNSTFLSSAFDSFPYVLLNLILSCIAAIQAPLIMMSQKRQEQKDRQRSENDYCVNLKTEIIIEDLHKKIDHLQRSQGKILKYIESTSKNMDK